MKIAVYHNLPSGGGKRALQEMVRRLAARHDIDVYTLTTANHDFADLRPYCREHIVFSFTPVRKFRRPFGRLNHASRTLDLIRLRTLQKHTAAQIDRQVYDVVFVHHCRFGQSPTLLQFLQTPSVYYCQEPPRILYEPPMLRPYQRHSTLQRLGNLIDPLPGLYRRTLQKMDRENVSVAAIVLANSAYSRESLYRAYGIFAQIAYLGVNVERFRPLNVPKEDFVLSVGHLNPRKGFDFLIRALGEITTKKRPRLRIVSNFTMSEERRFLEGIAVEYGVAVTFESQVSDERLVELYNRAALLVYAPVMEPFGFVPIEAMACGTPVVGVREGGVRETVQHKQTGVLSDRDPAAFAAAITHLLSDDELREEYGVRGQEYVKQEWSWTRSVDSLEKLLAEASGVR